MKATPWLVLAALAAPAAIAQTYDAPRDERVLSREELRECVAFDATMIRRRENLQAEQALLDREADELARRSQRLAGELGRLDSGNPEAVALYNARQAEHNRFVEIHNARVGDLNRGLAGLNEDNARAAPLCGRPYMPSDLDGVFYERARAR